MAAENTVESILRGRWAMKSGTRPNPKFRLGIQCRSDSCQVADMDLVAELGMDTASVSGMDLGMELDKDTASVADVVSVSRTELVQV